MADIWDDSVKRLFREHPQDFVSWLLQGATYRGTVSGELKNQTRRTDILLGGATTEPKRGLVARRDPKRR